MANTKVEMIGSPGARQAPRRALRSAVAPTSDRLLTPSEVAKLFRVDPKTVTRWASSGRIRSSSTPGGHRRFRESYVHELLRRAE
jgi:excisionase family DNA binding protein